MSTSAPEPAAAEPEHEVGPEPVPRQFRMRRAPKYRTFALTGALLGVVLGLALARLPAEASPGEGFSTRSVTGYFMASFGLTGILVGLALALLVERRRR